MEDKIKQDETTTQATPKRRRNAAETAAFKGKLLELVEARPGITGAEATQAVGEDAASTLSNMAKDGMIISAKADAKSVRGIPFNGYYPKVQTAQAATSRTAEIIRVVVSDRPRGSAAKRIKMQASDEPAMMTVDCAVGSLESVTATALIEKAKQQNISIHVSGGKLLLEGDSKPSPSFLLEIKENKEALISYLTGNCNPSKNRCNKTIETLTKEKEIRVARLAELREQIRRAVEKKRSALLAEIAALDTEEAELRKRLEELV